MDYIALHDGRIMQVHDRDQCIALFCCIHNPSKHPLNRAALSWRADLRIMERICPHGIGHPDPDDVNVLLGFSIGVHSCDGCCRVKTYRVNVTMEDEWLVILIPEINGATQAMKEEEIEYMARDYIACMMDCDIRDFNVDIHYDYQR